MTIDTKKPLTAITATILLSSLVIYAIQVQTIETENFFQEAFAGAIPFNDGDIIVALEQVNGFNQGIVLVDPVAGTQNFFSGVSDLPLEVKTDAAGDLIIATENGVLRLVAATLLEEEIANSGDNLLMAPAGMDLDSAGDIFVIDDDGVGNGLVVKIDPVSGLETLIASDVTITGSTDIALEPSGDILVLNVNSIFRVDPVSGIPTLLSNDVLGGDAVLFVSDAGDIYTAGVDVVSIDPITGVATTLSSGFTGITGIGIEADGNLIVVDVDADSTVYRVDSVSGAQTIVSSGNLFVDAFGTALTVFPAAAPPPVTCQGQIATIVGTDGNDMLTGTPGDDVIDGLNGDDVITGLDGNDIICGGGGDDFIDAGNGNDSVKGNGGKDVILGNEGNDILKGDGGKDNINGESGNDTIEGGDGDDIIVGGSEDDNMDGGLGIDFCEAEVNDITNDCETVSSI